VAGWMALLALILQLLSPIFSVGLFVVQPLTQTNPVRARAILDKWVSVQGEGGGCNCLVLGRPHAHLTNCNLQHDDYTTFNKLGALVSKACWRQQNQSSGANGRLSCSAH
jgi:hypothetical protein